MATLMPFLPVLWLFFDVYYFLRAALVMVVSRFTRPQEPPGPFTEIIYRGICLTTDLDFMCHMNNARYLRECDFARFLFWGRSHLYPTLRSMKANVTNRANNIRYRRSLEFLQAFRIHVKLLYWDERSFYLEQRIIRSSDNFICAINYTCQTITTNHVQPQDVLDKLYGHVERPKAPPEIAAWMHATELSSQTLRNAE